MFASNGLIMGNAAWSAEIEKRRAAKINSIVAKYLDACFDDDPASVEEIEVACERALGEGEFGDAEFLMGCC